MLGPAISNFYDQMQAQQNPKFVGQVPQIEAFDPSMPADLAADFRRPGDFYTTAATRFLKRKPADKAERNRFKAIILSIVYGLGAPSLAKTLACTKAEAKNFLADFDMAYPKVAAYKRLMYSQIAWTGQTSTFMARMAITFCAGTVRWAPHTVGTAYPGVVRHQLGAAAISRGCTEDKTR